MPEIPPAIITDIFCRLPVESLLRFRCVSSPMRLEIDSPEFAKLHIRQSIKSKSHISLVLGTLLRSIYSVDLGKLDAVVEVENPDRRLAVSGACNGLLLLKDASLQEYRLVLFNPATRKHKVIPICPLSLSHGDDDGFVLKSQGTPVGGPCGLGYDALNDDYKIISIVQFSSSGEWIGSKTTIYSLNRDEWKPMKNFRYMLPRVKELGVHLGGKFHTLVNRTGNFYYSFPDVILVTDLVEEDYRFMELPNFSSEDIKGVGLNVFESEESICFQLAYKDFHYEMWVMKEHGEKSSWTKLLSMAPRISPPSTCMDPLVLSKDWDKVLVSMNESKLCWYDIKGGKFMAVPVRGLPEEFYVAVCVNSLIQPNGYGTAKKDQQKALQNVVKKKQDNKKRDDFLARGFKLKL